MSHPTNVPNIQIVNETLATLTMSTSTQIAPSLTFPLIVTPTLPLTSSPPDIYPLPGTTYP